jgi:hypothetical protein
MIDENTFIFISWDVKSVYLDIESESSGYIYIFGKKSYKYYKKFKQLIDHDIINKRYTRIHSVYATNNSEGTGWRGITKRVISRPFDTLYFDNHIEEKIKDHIDKYLSEGIDRKEAMKLVAKDRGIPKREVYAALNK